MAIPATGTFDYVGIMPAGDGPPWTVPMETAVDRRDVGLPSLAGANPFAVAEPASSLTMARELIAQLLPGVDSDRLVRALLAERDPKDEPRAEVARYDSESEVAARELQRVRSQFVLGDASRTLQHAFNNPLTALLAETQLLELLVW